MKKQSDKTRKAPFIFPIDVSKLKFDEQGKPEKEIQVLPVGKWNHPAYGPIIIDNDDVSEFKKNFDQGLRNDIPITEGHEFMEEKPAVGWFRELIDRGLQGLFATVEWTPKGITLLREKAYKYFSPEFYSEYEDPETREIYANVLVGGALTNKPYFKELKAVVLSEQSIKNPYYKFNDNSMTIKDIVSKKVEELSDEEKSFLKDHKDELNDEQLASFGSVFESEASGDDKDDDKGGDDKDGKGAGEAGAGGDDKKTATEKKVTPEAGTVQINASELKALQDMANRGAQAFDELRKTKVKNETGALVFSEQNSQGKILPKDEQKVYSFMLGLTEAQRKVFAEIVKAIPSSKLFDEVGSSGGAEGTAAAELQKRVEKMMSETKGLQYSDAVRQVLAKDAEFSARYTAENKIEK